MARLAHSDLELLQGFLHSTAEYDGVAAFDGGVLAGLNELVPCDVALIREVDLTGARAPVERFVAPDAERRADHAAEQRELRHHPVVNAHALGSTQALSIADLIDVKALHRSALWADVMRPLDVEWEMDVPIADHGEHCVCEVVLGRHDYGFAERERDLLDAARPGIARALDRAHARERARAQGAHVLVLDAHGEVLQATPGSGPLLHEAFGPPHGGPSRLPQMIQDWLAVPPRPALTANGVSVRLLTHAGPDATHVLLIE